MTKNTEDRDRIPFVETDEVYAIQELFGLPDFQTGMILDAIEGNADSYSVLNWWGLVRKFGMCPNHEHSKQQHAYRVVRVVLLVLEGKVSAADVWEASQAPSVHQVQTYHGPADRFFLSLDDDKQDTKDQTNAILHIIHARL